MTVKTVSGSYYTFTVEADKVIVERKSEHCILSDVSNIHSDPVKGTENMKITLNYMPVIEVGHSIELGRIYTSRVAEILD